MNKNIVTVQNANESRKVSVREFIENELYGVLDLLIKDGKHVYFAFEVIATGIEFLGACLDPYKFEDSHHSKARFINAINTFSSLNKYAKFNLYDKLRCGMCHVLLPKLGLKLARECSELSQNSDTLYIGSFYYDFRNACSELLAQNSTLWGNGKSPNQHCWEVSTGNHNSTPTTASSIHK